MSKILAINLSPRKHGTSTLLLHECKDHLKECGHNVRYICLYEHTNNLQPIFDQVKDADTLILCGPCYVNTYPADTIKLLQELAAHPDILHGQNLYGIIQGGMPYAHTHKSGLNMLEIFSAKTDLNYKGGFVMGLGAMLDGHPLDNLPNGKKVKRQLRVFFHHIGCGELSPDSVYEAAIMKMPSIVARILARYMNRTIDKSYAKRGMDAYQPTPYLSDKINTKSSKPEHTNSFGQSAANR